MTTRLELAFATFTGNGLAVDRKSVGHLADLGDVNGVYDTWFGKIGVEYLGKEVRLDFSKADFLTHALRMRGRDRIRTISTGIDGGGSQQLTANALLLVYRNGESDILRRQSEKRRDVYDERRYHL